MRKPKKEIQLTSYDELLGINEAEQNTLNQIVEVPLNELHPFRNHPFHVNDDEKMALNQILYGPPGIGKTYNTINKAISIINPDFDLTQDRQIVKKEFGFWGGDEYSNNPLALKITEKC